MAACPQTESRTDTISYTELLTDPPTLSLGCECLESMSRTMLGCQLTASSWSGYL